MHHVLHVCHLCDKFSHHWLVAPNLTMGEPITDPFYFLKTQVAYFLTIEFFFSYMSPIYLRMGGKRVLTVGEPFPIIDSHVSLALISFYYLLITIYGISQCEICCELLCS